MKNNDYLIHHGIKGQKWGVRRFQNKDGSLTFRGRSRYNYKESDSYKNGTRGERQKQSGDYNYNKMRYGERSANRIQYDVNERGKTRKQALKAEKRRRQAMGAALLIGSAAFDLGVRYGKVWYHNQKVYVQMNNIGVNEYARQAGIPNDGKIGVGLGFGAAAKGKAFYDKYYNKA